MARRCAKLLLAVLTFGSALLVPAVAAHADVVLVDSFETSLCLDGIARDPVSGDLYLHESCYDPTALEILQYKPDGSFVDAIPAESAGGSMDLDFATKAFNLGGTLVPSNMLLEADFSTMASQSNQIFGKNKNTGAVLSQVGMGAPAGDTEGGGFSPGKTFFQLGGRSIVEIAPRTGQSLDNFTISPSGAPLFTLYPVAGDADVEESSGHVFVVSRAQDTIRELLPGGGWLRDFDVSGIGISDMTGIALFGNGEAWITSLGGTVYHVSGLTPTSCANPPPGYNAVPGGPADEVLIGTSDKDIICGEGGNDTLQGLGGDDILIGGPGNDLLEPSTGDDVAVNGGTGSDTVSYAAETSSGMTIDLVNHETSGVGGDTLGSIENAIGSTAGDYLLGDKHPNVLQGVAGEDSIDGGFGNDTIAGGADNDDLVGGPGVDTLSYSTITVAGQTVNLSTNSSTGGGGTDTISGFENVTGSPRKDTLTGSSKANLLRGLAGGDTLSTADGISGNDTADGGTGTDSCSVDAGDTVVSCE